MKFGLGLITCQRYPGDSRTPADLYDEALEVAVEAERLGFDSVWVSEHHFLGDGYMPSLLPFCAAIAARTSKIMVGTGLLLAPLYQPIRLAEDAASVDLIANGRFVLGLGQGWRPEEFDVLEVPLEDRARRLEDTISTLRKAWRGEAIREGVFVTPRPVSEEGPSIWLGAWTERAIRRAGRLADGYMMAKLEVVTPSTLRQEFGWALEERGETVEARVAGTFALATLVGAFVWSDPDEGWQRVLPHLHYLNWRYETMGEGSDGRRALEAPPITAAREDQLRSRILAGNGVEIAETIAAYRDAVGDDLHFIARLYWPGMDRRVRLEAMAIFADQVIGAFAK